MAFKTGDHVRHKTSREHGIIVGPSSDADWHVSTGLGNMVQCYEVTLELIAESTAEDAKDAEG